MLLEDPIIPLHLVLQILELLFLLLHLSDLGIQLPLCLRQLLLVSIDQALLLGDLGARHCALFRLKLLGIELDVVLLHRLGHRVCLGVEHLVLDGKVVALLLAFLQLTIFLIEEYLLVLQLLLQLSDLLVLVRQLYLQLLHFGRACRGAVRRRRSESTLLGLCLLPLEHPGSEVHR